MQTPRGKSGKRTSEQATLIECLACGAQRVVFGIESDDTGECPRCRYLGWTYSDDLDGTTRRMIMNGAFAGATAGRPGSEAAVRRSSARRFRS